MMTDRFPAIRFTMLPRDTNAHGTIFGGVILRYIDLAGCMACGRQCPRNVGTQSRREVQLMTPVHLADLVTIYSRATRVRAPSISVKVEVEVGRRGSRGTKGVVRVTEREVIYVPIDEDGRPVPVSL